MFFILVDKLRANCHIFLSFGTEAFLSYIEWTFIAVAHHQKFQKLMLKEINQVVGLTRLPDFKDQMRMPLVRAFLCEVLRWKTVLPFSLPRRFVLSSRRLVLTSVSTCSSFRSLEDATILGNFIPKKTLLMANIWAVHHDASIWECPFDFDPYRFLSDDGKTFIEHEAFIPFSLGKRSCVAEPFVRNLIFISFVSVLQKFTIKMASNVKFSEEEFDFILKPKHDVQLVFELVNQNEAFN